MQSAKKKNKGKNQECARVQSHSWRVSEVSCENFTHSAVGAVPKGHYVQRDIVGVWNTHEMSGYGTHDGLRHGFWDSEGIYENEYTIVI